MLTEITFNLVGDHQRFSAGGEEEEDEDEDVSYLRQSMSVLCLLCKSLDKVYVVALHLHDRGGESKYQDEYVVNFLAFRMLNAKTLNRNTDTVWTERDPRSERTENRRINTVTFEFQITASSPRLREVTFSSLPMIRAVGSLLGIAFSQSSQDTNFDVSCYFFWKLS